jgi:hypothetical protein
MRDTSNASACHLTQTSAQLTIACSIVRSSHHRFLLSSCESSGMGKSSWSVPCRKLDCLLERMDVRRTDSELRERVYQQGNCDGRLRMSYAVSTVCSDTEVHPTTLWLPISHQEEKKYYVLCSSQYSYLSSDRRQERAYKGLKSWHTRILHHASTSQTCFRQTKVSVGLIVV